MIDENKIIACKYEDKEKFTNIMNRKLNEILLKIIETIQIKEKIIKHNSIDQKKLYNVQYRCEEYLQIAVYDIPLKCFGLLNTLIKIPSEQCKFKECQAITHFLKDYQSKGKNLTFNVEIEKIFESVFLGYKKAKQQELLVESYLRLITYYTYFTEKTNEMWEKVQRLYHEVNTMNSLMRYKIYIKMYAILQNANMKRRSILFLCLSIMACYDNNELTSLIPLLYEELNKSIEIYDIEENQIKTSNDFDEIHKMLVKHSFKKNINYTTLKDESKDKIVVNNKKRIEKENNLYVFNRLKDLSGLLLIPKWTPIQYNIFTSMIALSKKIKEPKIKIANICALLQTLPDSIGINEQKEFIQEHYKESLYLQEKFTLNLIKLPILVKIKPLTSEIKFAFNRNAVQSRGDNVFIYNPWDKSLTANYFWTVNSYQKILIQFYNPLLTEINLTKINLIFDGENKPFTYPSNAIIEPNSITDILYKIKLTKEGPINLIGVRYEIENTTGVQYVDKNGNGIFYSYENFSNDSLSIANNKKEIITLRNVMIYPEIPSVSLKVLNEELNDDSYEKTESSVQLYEYQKYLFELLLTNNSEYPIEKLSISIYGFKKDDYKVIIDEFSLSGNNFNNAFISTGESFKYKYDYVHKNKYKKIEFRFFYSGKNKEDEPIRPFLHFITKINTKKLLSFSNLQTSPMLSNHAIEKMISSDMKNNNSYSFNFCSDKYYIKYKMTVAEEFNVKYEMSNQYNKILPEDSIDSKHSKEISMLVDLRQKLSDTVLNWKIESDNIEGTINLSQIISNELNYKFMNTFMFTITPKMNQENEYVSIYYDIQNKSQKIFKNLKLRIYLYQLCQDSFLINKKLDQNIFYEGSLCHTLSEFKPNETQTFNVKLFPNYNEYVHTTCAIIDTNNKIIYIPSYSQMCLLQK